MNIELDNVTDSLSDGIAKRIFKDTIEFQNNRMGLFRKIGTFEVAEYFSVIAEISKHNAQNVDPKDIRNSIHNFPIATAKILDREPVEYGTYASDNVPAYVYANHCKKYQLLVLTTFYLNEDHPISSWAEQEFFGFTIHSVSRIISRVKPSRIGYTLKIIQDIAAILFRCVLNNEEEQEEYWLYIPKVGAALCKQKSEKHPLTLITFISDDLLTNPQKETLLKTLHLRLNQEPENNPARFWGKQRLLIDIMNSKTASLPKKETPFKIEYEQMKHQKPSLRQMFF